LVTPDGQRLELAAQVVQIAPGAGIALTFDAASPAAADLAALVASAATLGSASTDRTVEVYWGEPEAAPAAEPVGALETEEPLDDAPLDAGEVALLDVADDATAEETETLARQIRAMTTPEKMRLAMHGDRPARMLLLKDPNKTIQLFILQNKRITLGEVLYLAAYRQANPEALARIGDNRDWTSHPGMVTALVGNPKTPTPTALRLLRQLGAAELRRLAKSPNVPRAVSQAAKRLVIGS
jgi:hypothetical protein